MSRGTGSNIQHMNSCLSTTHSFNINSYYDMVIYAEWMKIHSCVVCAMTN